jgi:short-subunit dehydrogenase
MRSPEKEEELVKSENVLVTTLAVQDIHSVKAAVNAGLQRFGSIDVVVNNAGYGLMGVFESATKEQIKKQFDVNLFGMMNVTQEVLPHLRAHGGGTIINISSFGGFVGVPFGSLYNSTKFAVEGFSESLSHELFKLNIAVKIVEPGGVQTNFRNGLDMIKNEIPEYNPLVEAFWANYAKATETLPKATAKEVANMIYKAATDGKTQLRYVVGDDAQFYIDTKMKNSDQEFVGLIRGLYIK